MGLTRLTIPRHERALLWKNRRFAGVLGPGVRWIIAPLMPVSVQLYDITVPEFDHPCATLLLREARATLGKYFEIVEMSSHEIGIVYKNGEFAGVLAPGKRQLYWKGPVAIRVERIDLSTGHEVRAAPSIFGVLNDLVRVQVPAN